MNNNLDMYIYIYSIQYGSHVINNKIFYMFLCILCINKNDNITKNI